MPLARDQFLPCPDQGVSGPSTISEGAYLSTEVLGCDKGALPAHPNTQAFSYWLVLRPRRAASSIVSAGHLSDSFGSAVQHFSSWSTSSLSSLSLFPSST